MKRLEDFRKKIYDFIQQDKAGAFKSIENYREIDHDTKMKLRNVMNENAFLSKLNERIE